MRENARFFKSRWTGSDGNDLVAASSRVRVPYLKIFRAKPASKVIRSEKADDGDDGGDGGDGDDGKKMLPFGYVCFVLLTFREGEVRRRCGNFENPRVVFEGGGLRDRRGKEGLGILKIHTWLLRGEELREAGEGRRGHC
jgi:hypothetical protein